MNQLKELQEIRAERLKKSGSEPDLRHRLRQEISKAVESKKYDDWLIRRRSSQTNKEGRDGDCRNTKRVGLFKTSTEKSNSLNPGLRNNSELKDGIDTLESNDINDELHLRAFPNNNKPVKYDVKRQNISRSDENSVKKYYFGMENPEDSSLDYDIGNYVKSSDISDELLSNFSNNLDDSTDFGSSQKIVLKLRPILPKKRLEIPKFSSSLAWKLLYSAAAVDSDQNADRGSTNEEEFSCEERIAPFSPSRLSKSLEFQFSQDKSGDSGISGDETPKPAATWGQYYKNKQSWTPQEDLGDDDTTTDEEDDRKFNSVPYHSGNCSNKPHIFSLSLPRDHFSNQCALEKYKNQLKRSASGIFSSSEEFEAGIVENRAIKNSNWLLSKSAPNSLNNVPLDNGRASLMVLQSHGNNQQQAGTRRIMYLPSGEEQGYLQMEAGENGSKATVEEVERREQERLKEMEAMQRIEEEFKRKRARLVLCFYEIYTG